MITDFIMQILSWLVFLLPSWAPLGWLDSKIDTFAALPPVASAIGFMGWVDHYVPVSEMFIMLSLALTVMVAAQVYSGIMWVWRNLPGKAT